MYPAGCETSLVNLRLAIQLNFRPWREKSPKISCLNTTTTLRYMEILGFSVNCTISRIDYSLTWSYELSRSSLARCQLLVTLGRGKTRSRWLSCFSSSIIVRSLENTCYLANCFDFSTSLRLGGPCPSTKCPHTRWSEKNYKTNLTKILRWESISRYWSRSDEFQILFL